LYGQQRARAYSYLTSNLLIHVTRFVAAGSSECLHFFCTLSWSNAKTRHILYIEARSSAMLVRTGDTLPSSLMPIHSSRKQIMIPTSFILKTEEHSTEGGHRRLVRAGNLHRCTDAENRVEKLPLCATFRAAQRSAKAETSRRMSNCHKRIRTGLCSVGRCRKKVANTRGKVAQVKTVVVHYL
jgi:hypothetical protein